MDMTNIMPAVIAINTIQALTITMGEEIRIVRVYLFGMKHAVLKDQVSELKVL